MYKISNKIFSHSFYQNIKIYKTINILLNTFKTSIFKYNLKLKIKVTNSLKIFLSYFKNSLFYIIDFRKYWKKINFLIKC
jgi:hypothetical protein